MSFCCLFWCIQRLLYRRAAKKRSDVASSLVLYHGQAPVVTLELWGTRRNYPHPINVESYVLPFKKKKKGGGAFDSSYHIKRVKECCYSRLVFAVHLSQVRLYTLEENHMLRFKVEMHVGVAAEQTFQLLSDLRRRKEWDQHYKLVFGMLWDFIYRGINSCSEFHWERPENCFLWWRQGVWGDHAGEWGRHPLSCDHTICQQSGERQRFHPAGIEEEAVWFQVTPWKNRPSHGELRLFYHFEMCSFLFSSEIHTWSHCVPLVCRPIRLLTVTTGERCSVLASQSGRSPELSPRSAECWQRKRFGFFFSPSRCLTQWVWFQITYYNQATPGVLPYIATDIVGLSSSFYSSFSACSHFLEANKDVLTASSLWHPPPITLSLFTCCRNSRLDFWIQVFNVELCIQKKRIYFHCVFFF